MPAHKNLTGADLHEPKGVAAASAGTVYVADGAGSGSWGSDYLKSSTTKNTNRMTVDLAFTDVGTAGSQYTAAPLAGKIIKIYTILQGAAGGSNTIVTAKIGGVSVTNGAVTIVSSGSAAGQVNSATPTALNVLTAGQAIELASDGGTSSVVACRVILILDVS